MGVVRVSTAALFIALAVLGAGCSRQQNPSTPTAQLATSPAESPTAEATAAPTEALDPYAIPEDPDDIDEEYVERVLLALDRGVVEATAEFARSKEVTPAVTKALKPTHLPSARSGYIAAYKRALSAPGPLPFRRNPRLVDIVSVDEIVTATRSCIFVGVTQDSSGLLNRSIKPFPVYYHLLRKQDAENTAANPTPWMIAADAEPPKGGKEFRDPCEA